MKKKLFKNLALFQRLKTLALPLKLLKNISYSIHSFHFISISAFPFFMQKMRMNFIKQRIFFFGIYGNFFVQKLPPPPVPISSRKLKLMDRWKVHKTKITDHTRQIQISLTSITEYLMDKWKAQQTKVTENTKFS